MFIAGSLVGRYDRQMSNLRKASFFPYLALGFGLAAIGSSAVLLRLASTPGVTAVLYRMTIATVVTLPIFLRRRASAGPLPARGVQIALLAGVFFALDLSAWGTGVVLGGATNPTLMANTAPLWVGIGAFFIFRERLGPRFWVGVLLAMLGAALVIQIDISKSFHVGAGTLLGLLASVFYGSYFLITQRGRERLDALSFFWISAFSASLCLLLFSLSFHLPIVGFSVTSYLYLVAMGLVTQVAGWLTINYAQGLLPASVVSPTLLGQPVVTALLAGPLLGEWIGPLEVVGGVAVLAGILLVHQSRLRQPSQRPVDRPGV